MQSSNQIEIPLSKKKIVQFILLCFVIIGGGFWIIGYPPIIKNPILGNPTLLLIIGITNVVVFGLALIFLIKMFLDKRPGLIISNKGITDNSSFISAGFVPWTDIIDIHEIKVNNNPMINIVVKNPPDYLNRQKNILIKYLLQISYKTNGLVICIPPNTLKHDYKELKTLLVNKLKEKMITANARNS